MSKIITVGGSTVFTTPNAAAMNITDSLDFRARVAASDWTPAVAKAIYNQNGGVANRLGLYVSIEPDGEPRLFWSDDGGVSQKNSKCDTATGLANTDATTLKITANHTTGDAMFYLDDVQLGSTDTAGYSGMSLPTEKGEVGRYRTFGGAEWVGDIYWIEERDGIGGSVVSRISADDAYSTHGYGGLADGETWTDSVTGQVWTVVGVGASVGIDVAPFKHGPPIASPGQLLRTGG